MATYAKVSLSARSLSKEYLDGLLQLTFDLLAKEQLDLSFDERLKLAIAGLASLHQEFKQTLGKNANSDSKPSLADLDRLRDNDLTDFRYYIRSQLRHRQEKRRQAAQELQAFLAGFGDMRNLSHDEQTQVIRQLIKGMEDKDIRAKMATIGASEYYGYLKESQQKFEEGYLEKTKERQQVKARQGEQAKARVTQHYREIYGYLLALEYFDKESSHRPVLAVFNAARLSYQDKVKRKTQQAKKKTKLEEPVALLEEPTLGSD